MRMTLDELINAMEPQARKDKALISKCVDGLTEYAAELRQKAGDAGKEQISALRRLVDELAGYWGLDAKTVDHVTAFDRKIQEVDQAVHQWTPIQPHHNRGSLKNRADEIAMELQRILAQKASAGICGRESKESLAYRWLELAASCAKVPIRYEADQIKQRQKEEQAQRGAGPVME